MARLTARQKQSRRISREKAKKKRLKTFTRWSAGALGGIVALAIFASWIGWYDAGRLQHVTDQGKAAWYELTASLGFTVQHVYLDGRQHTPGELIREALQLNTGMPMFAVSLESLRSRLEKIDRVAHADVERALPDTLHVHIVERNPVAIWQNKGVLQLVDETGAVMKDARVKNYTQLPVVVGEDAPLHVPDLFAMISTEPVLAKEVNAAIRVGERRWNLKLADNIEVKLPERDAQAAWHALARAAREDKLLNRNIRAVDLRLNDRMFIRLAPSALNPKSALPASET